MTPEQRTLLLRRLRQELHAGLTAAQRIEVIADELGDVDLALASKLVGRAWVEALSDLVRAPGSPR